MAMNKRFEARKIKASDIKAEDMAGIWGVYDTSRKNWYPIPATNKYDAELIADSMNNGHIKP